MNQFYRKSRLIFLLVFSILIVGVVVFNYGRLAFTPVSVVTQKQQEPERGSIVDRNGAPLAVQTDFYHIGVTPKQIKDKESFAVNIAPALEMMPDEVYRIIRSASNSSFVYLKKKVDQAMFSDVKAIINEYGYNFVSYDKVPGRVYPNHTLASQLVGYMGDDGQGLEGIEYSQNEILSSSQNGDVLESGKNVYLTIDSSLQYKLEQISFEAMNDTQAESMMLLAVNAKNGEILSYISLPEADLNDFRSSSMEERRNRPAMSAYEPGSVFKIFTVSVLYDEGKIKQDDSFLCDGMYEYRIPRGETVRIKCLEYHGWLTPRDALRFSCNDVLGQISDKIGEDEFMARIRQFGFGQKTGVELPGESAGSVKDTSSKLWSARSKPTIAIGQEISVTALQMVEAATAIANGGIPVKLSVINKITNKDGSLYYEHVPEYKDRILKKSTADYVLSCMETTATTGTGSRANLRDISIGVKTGTAQMADKEKGGYSETDFLSNCIAVFPIEDPEIILYIVIEKAKGETYAGRIVAPVIAKAADTIIDHLGMSRGDAASLEHSGLITIQRSAAVTIGEDVPDFTGLNKRDLAPLLERSDINVNVHGSGWVTSQLPEPGAPVTENMTIELYLE